MNTFVPYCLRLVYENRSAISDAGHQLAGVDNERRIPVSDSLYTWWWEAIRLVPSEAGILLSIRVDFRKDSMASHQRPGSHRKTLGAPRSGRRVSLSLSEYQHRLLSYYAERFRITPQELLRGMIAWIPEQPGDKFLTILLGVTQCHTLSRDVTPKNNKTTESRNVRKTVH